MKLHLLIDTSVWLDLAKDYRQLPVLDALSAMSKADELALILPRIVVDEFERNKERVIAESTSRATLLPACPGHRVRAVVRRRGYRPITRTFDTRKEADVWAADVQRQMAPGVFADLGPAVRLPLHRAIELYSRQKARLAPGDEPD